MAKIERFGLGLEESEYQSLARQFATREMASQARLCDLSPAIPRAVLERMHSLGLVNVRIPEAYGGLALRTVDACLIAAELAFACSGIASFGEASELAIMPVILFGSQEQKQTLLTPLAEKPTFAGLSLSYFEEQRAPLRAVRSAGKYVINGAVDRVMNAHVGDWLLIEAEISDGQEDVHGSGAEKSSWGTFCLPTRAPGLTISSCAPTMGRRACDLSLLKCCDVELSEHERLICPKDRQTFRELLKRYNYPVIAAGCLGVAKAALVEAVRYAKERRAFGKPIAEHQGLAFMLADMARAQEATRCMIWQAARACDLGQDGSTLAQAAKAYAQATAMSLTTDAVQIFGGYGYSKEYPVEKLMRDAKIYQLFYGNAEETKGELGRAFLRRARAQG